jgi:hypothetical protein
VFHDGRFPSGWRTFDSRVYESGLRDVFVASLALLGGPLGAVAVKNCNRQATSVAPPNAR